MPTMKWLVQLCPLRVLLKFKNYFWTNYNISKLLPATENGKIPVTENVVSKYLFHIHLPSLSYLFYYVGFSMS